MATVVQAFSLPAGLMAKVDAQLKREGVSRGRSKLVTDLLEHWLEVQGQTFE